MAVGIGISVKNALAVIEAICGVKSEFVRTPKYRVEADAKQSGSWTKKSYSKRPGLLPFVEIALGVYFAAAVLYAIQNECVATVPFFILFVWGYLYTGVMSLTQTYFSGFRLRAATVSVAPTAADIATPTTEQI